jgi:hypothetical protein
MATLFERWLWFMAGSTFALVGVHMGGTDGWMAPTWWVVLPHVALAIAACLRWVRVSHDS